MSGDDEIYSFAEDDTPKGPPPRASAMPVAKPAPLPCPDCGYELRGTRLDRCPECGKVITSGVLNRISNKSKVNLWRDVYKEPVLWAAFGTAVGMTAWGIDMGLMGLLAFLVYGLFLVATGWVIFLICSLIWIGFDQPLHTIAVQLAGVYLGVSGISVLTDLIPIPLIPWLINLAFLIGLLQKLLDIDTNDAIAVAIFVNLGRVFIVVYVFLLFGF